MRTHRYLTSGNTASAAAGVLPHPQDFVSRPGQRGDGTPEPVAVPVATVPPTVGLTGGAAPVLRPETGQRWSLAPGSAEGTGINDPPTRRAWRSPACPAPEDLDRRLHRRVRLAHRRRLPPSVTEQRLDSHDCPARFLPESSQQFPLPQLPTAASETTRCRARAWMRAWERRWELISANAGLPGWLPNSLSPGRMHKPPAA